MTTECMAETKGTGAYAEVNGINLYYETHGSGRPLLLLHGGLGSGEMFGPILPTLAEHRQVIAVDLQGHGRTADIDRPIDVRLMADDIAALIDHIGLDSRTSSARSGAIAWNSTSTTGSSGSRIRVDQTGTLGDMRGVSRHRASGASVS